MAVKHRWVVGTHACIEALKTHPDAVVEICFENIQDIEAAPWPDLLKKIKARPKQKKASFFNQLSEFGHQGVAVSVSKDPEWPEPEHGLLVYLDQVGDPQNLGAIMRTAWLMEATGIGVTERNSVKLTPAVCKVASGGAEHVPVMELNFVSEIKALQKNGYWVYGFSDKADKSLYDMKFSENSIFVFGSEEKGLRSSVLNACDEVISIPQAPSGSSYNISVSVGIALAEYNRQVKWLQHD